MLSALRLLPRQSTLLMKWGKVTQGTRLIQKQGEEESVTPQAAAPVEVAASASAPTQTEPSTEAVASASQIAATFQAIRRMFTRCTSVDELLAVAEQRELTRTEALIWVTSVAHMAMEKHVPVDTVIKHPCYQRVSERVRASSTDQLPPHRLITSARALSELGVPPSDPLFSSLVTDLIWNLRKMTMKQLVQSLRLANSSASSKYTTQLLTLSREAIQRRWVEIDSADEIVPLLKDSDKFPAEFLRRLEDRALDTASGASASEVSRLLSVMAEKGRRPPPLLRALCFHAARQPEPVAVKDAVRTLFALQRLSFPDQMLLEKLGRDLVTQMPAVERANVVSSALTAAGQLHWRNVDFLEAAAGWYEKNLDLLRAQDVVSLIITLATVSYSPANARTLIPALLSRCGPDDLPTPQVWLDLVWSLAVLGHGSAERVSSVLGDEFGRRLEQARPHLGSRLKLANLAAYARLQHEYQGPPPAASLGGDGQPLAPPRSRETDALQKEVLESLVNFLPPPRYLHVCSAPVAGCSVDAEFIVSDDGSPVPCERYGSALPGAPPPAERLPPSVHRVALCTWTYRDLTLDSVVPTGFNHMTLKLLELSGYKVLQVYHSELGSRDSQVVKTKLLRQKIRDLVAR